MIVTFLSCFDKGVFDVGHKFDWLKQFRTDVIITLFTDCDMIFQPYNRWIQIIKNATRIKIYKYVRFVFPKRIEEDWT